MRRGWKITATAAAATLVLVLVAIATAPWWLDFNRLRGPAAGLIGHYTGRHAAIGSIHLDMGWVPELSVGGIVLGNADWAERDEMVRIERVRVSIRLKDLLHGRITLPLLSVAAPRINLARNADGEANWQFGTPEPEPEEEPAARGDVPAIRHLRITHADIRYTDATRDFQFVAAIDRFSGSAGGDAPLRADAEGRIQNQPFTLKLDAGSIPALHNEDQPYPLDLDVAIGKTHGAFKGTLDRPLALRGLDIDLRVSGPNLAALYPVLGVPLPATPPYRLSGLLQHRGTVWGFKGFDGQVGDSDLAGDFGVDIGGERMQVNADLTSNKLDFDDLAPIVGAPPDASETASAKQEQKSDQVVAGDKVIPDTPFELDKLRSADADVKLVAKHIQAPGLPIDDLHMDMQLTDGVLRFKPLRFGVADGNMNAYATIDASRPTIGWDYDVRMRRFKLGKLLTAPALEDAGSGVINGNIKLAARGNSPHAIAADSDGRVTVVMAGGRFSHLLLELAGEDFAQALGVLASGDKKKPIRCVVADLDVTDGMLRSRKLVVDTEDTRIDGKLTADLGAETFELRLKPNPKDPSIFSARTPVSIGGSFKDVGFSPDYTSLGLRAGAATALGVLATPAAALLAFVEPGLGEDAQCQGLLDAADTKLPAGQAP